MPGFPPPNAPRTIAHGSPFTLGRPVIDSLGRAAIQFCASPQGFKLHTFRSGTIRGFHFRPDERGLWVSTTTLPGDRERRVDWTDIRRVEVYETRERTATEAWTRGAQIGYAAGILVAMLVIPEPGDFGFLVYPLTIVIAALPGGIAGGLIGLEFRGQIRSWDHCWP